MIANPKLSYIRHLVNKNEESFKIYHLVHAITFDRDLMLANPDFITRPKSKWGVHNVRNNNTRTHGTTLPIRDCVVVRILARVPFDNLVREINSRRKRGDKERESGKKIKDSLMARKKKIFTG